MDQSIVILRFILYNAVEESMKNRLFLLLMVFSFYTLATMGNNNGTLFIQQHPEIPALQPPQMEQELVAQIIDLIPLEREYRFLMGQESIDSFLNNPQTITQFFQSIPEVDRRPLIDLLKNRDMHPLKDWLCMYHLNGYERGITLRDVDQLGFKKFYFLIALYEKARVYAPIDIRNNEGLQAIYDNLGQEIKDFIYYYVVTPDHSAVALPTLANAARKSSKFLLRLPFGLLTNKR